MPHNFPENIIKYYVWLVIHSINTHPYTPTSRKHLWCSITHTKHYKVYALFRNFIWVELPLATCENSRRSCRPAAECGIASYRSWSWFAYEASKRSRRQILNNWQFVTDGRWVKSRGVPCKRFSEEIPRELENFKL